MRSSSARPGTSLSLRRLAGLVVVLQGVRCALPRPHGASSNQLRAHVKWSFILALLSGGRACCECLKDWLVHLLLASCLFVNVRGSYHCDDHVFRCPPQTAAVFPLCPGRPDMYMWLSAPYAKARVLSFASVRLQPRQLGYLQSLQTSASRSALLCGVTLDVRSVVGFWPHERHFGYRQSRQRAPIFSVYCRFLFWQAMPNLSSGSPS